MPAPRATDAPTREGVTIHRNGLFDLPAKRKSWSEAGYRARYDTDPVYVWTYSNAPHACPARFHVAGPVSANVLIRSFLAKGEPVVVFWGDDPDPSAAENLYSDRANAIPVELRGIWESRLPEGRRA